VEDDYVATIEGQSTWFFQEPPTNITFSLEGLFLGWTTVTVTSDVDTGSSSSSALPVSVIRRKSVLDTVFLFSVIGLVCLAYVNMGCKLDFEVIKGVVRRPKVVVIGVFAKYLFMPLVSEQ
jgi:sodium/bile acid cotransporter 3/5